MKKKIPLFVVFFLISINISAQGLNIGVVVPEEPVNGVNSNAFKALGTKLERMITACGATSFNSGNVVLFPVLTFLSDDMIEGGMRNIYSCEYELTVKAVSLNNNTTFGSVTWSLNGKGYSKTEAVREGFNKISPNDQRFASFFSEIRRKIETYYISNRSSIIAKAKALAVQKQFEEAISILYEYPSGITGYNEIQTTLGNIYKQYQTANCSQILQEARAKYAVQDYEAAIALISDIDASSSCASDARSLSNQIRQKINSDQAVERANSLEKQRIAASVEKARIRAVSNMVSAYYKSRPRVTYNTVIIRRW